MFKRFVIGIGCLGLVASTLWAQSGVTPGCNGKTINPAFQQCGQGRGCNGTPPNCIGTAVLSSAVYPSCLKGSANEFCSMEPVICTTTFHCKKSLYGGGCIPDVNNPFMFNNQPVVSMTMGAVAKTCIAP